MTTFNIMASQVKRVILWVWDYGLSSFKVIGWMYKYIGGHWTVTLLMCNVVLLPAAFDSKVLLLSRFHLPSITVSMFADLNLKGLCSFFILNLVSHFVQHFFNRKNETKTMYNPLNLFCMKKCVILKFCMDGVFKLKMLDFEFLKSKSKTHMKGQYGYVRWSRPPF